MTAPREMTLELTTTQLDTMLRNNRARLKRLVLEVVQHHEDLHQGAGAQAVVEALVVLAGDIEHALAEPDTVRTTTRDAAPGIEVEPPAVPLAPQPDGNAWPVDGPPVSGSLGIEPGDDFAQAVHLVRTRQNATARRRP